MPDKEGSDDEKKSAKSVVNKKQKQFMNQEDYIPEQEDSSMNVQKKKSTSELRREIEQRNVERVKRRDDKRRSDAIQAKSTFNQAAEYATKQRPKIGGGERPDLKSKGGSASTGTSDIKIGGPKKDPKSAGGKPKGNTPVKVDTKKKPDLSKYFGDEYIPEEGYDIARDMGRVRPSKDKKDATTMPVSKEMRKTQKVNKGPSAFERVKAKYGKSVMNVGKKKVKEELDLTKVAEAFGGYIVEQEDDKDKNQNQQQQEKPPLRDRVNKGSGSRTIRVGGKGKPRRGFEDVTGEGKVKFPKNREELEAKRKEYEIDAKGNITDRGVEKYARQIYRTNLPLTKAQLNKARQFAVGGKKIKDSKGNVIGTTTGKYGGALPPKASEEEMKQTQAYLKKRGLKVPDKIKPQKDRVTTGDDRKTDTMSRVDFPEPEKPKPSIASKVGTALKKSPVTPLIAYDIGKGILSKIMNLRGPAIRGGRAGFRSAGGNVAT